MSTYKNTLYTPVTRAPLQAVDNGEYDTYGSVEIRTYANTNDTLNGAPYATAEIPQRAVDNGEYEVYVPEPSANPAKKTSKKKLIICIVILSTLLFIVCGGFAGYFIAVHNTHLSA